MSREYDAYFEKIFKAMTRGMEDHEFRHYNHSMGMMIYSKEQYKMEMKRRRMVPYEETERLAQKWDEEHPRQEYGEISPKAQNIIRSLRQTADKHGNIKLGSRAIKALMDVGAITPQSEHRPQGIRTQGGFN